MIQFLLAAPRSGSGKTTMTCALLMALKRRGCALRLQERADYIDPMFHRAVLGVESRASTSFFLRPRRCAPSTRRVPPDTVRRCEGGYGLYDGPGASATEPARGIWPTHWTCRCRCWWWSRKVRA